MEIFGPPHTRSGGKFFSLLVTSTKVNPGLDPTGELLGCTAGPLGTRPLLGFTLRPPPVMCSGTVLLGPLGPTAGSLALLLGHWALLLGHWAPLLGH